MRSKFSLTVGGVVKNVIIFRVVMSSSRFIDNKGKYILILTKHATQVLHGTMLTVKAQKSVHFS